MHVGTYIQKFSASGVLSAKRAASLSTAQKIQLAGGIKAHLLHAQGAQEAPFRWATCCAGNDGAGRGRKLHGCQAQATCNEMPEGIAALRHNGSACKWVLRWQVQQQQLTPAGMPAGPAHLCNQSQHK